VEVQSSAPSFKAEAAAASATIVKSRGISPRSAPRRRPSRSTVATATAAYTFPMSVYPGNSTCLAKPQLPRMWLASTKLNMWQIGAANAFMICPCITRLTVPRMKDVGSVGSWSSRVPQDSPMYQRRGGGHSQ